MLKDSKFLWIIPNKNRALIFISNYFINVGSLL